MSEQPPTVLFPHFQVWHVSFPEQPRYDADCHALEEKLEAACYSPQPSHFYKLFPFHILMDKELRIVQV